MSVGQKIGGSWATAATATGAVVYLLGPQDRRPEVGSGQAQTACCGEELSL